MEKTRKELIQEKLDKYSGGMIQAFSFYNHDIPYIPYWYDGEKDCFVSDCVSIPFHYEIETIDDNLIDRKLTELESQLIDYYKSIGIELILPQD